MLPEKIYELKIIATDGDVIRKQPSCQGNAHTGEISAVLYPTAGYAGVHSG